MENNHKNRGLLFVVTLIFSAFASFILALLFAPNSGSLTRKWLKDIKGDVFDNTSAYYTDKKERLSGYVDKGKDLLAGTKSAISNIIDAGKDVMMR
ncbi:MAG: YtxH domain-containing protein [Candidatus Magnetoovum sp. WYHC-5]|nr:YtxH domain-containing protein [Candidatus Magnetoovum sp. WYHC-5]